MNFEINGSKEWNVKVVFSCPQIETVKPKNVGLLWKQKNDVPVIFANPGEKPIENVKLESIAYEFNRLVAKVIGVCKKEDLFDLEFDLDTLPEWISPADMAYSIGFAPQVADYKFDELKAKKDNKKIANISIKVANPCEKLSERFKEGIVVGKHVCGAKTLVNTPSTQLTPEKLGEYAKELDGKNGLSVKVICEEGIKELGMTGLLNVSRAAVNKPVMIEAVYRGNPEKPEETNVFVGKGIMYDSGGLSLKPGPGMVTMQGDMAGAAAVLSVIQAVAEMGLKTNLTVLVPACENMLAPNGYRNGDIITMMNGKTVLINSTDAEGRLILADAITYALKDKNVKNLVDIATLTGGAARAYGNLVSAAAFGGNFPKCTLKAASDNSGDLVCEMPLANDYVPLITPEHADLANSTGGDGPAMITAALFLREFTENSNWLHLDIAGTSWSSKNTDLHSYGATGAGTSLLYFLAKEL